MCFNEQVNTDLTIWVDTLQCRRHEGLTGCKKPQTSCAREKKKKHIIKQVCSLILMKMHVALSQTGGIKHRKQTIKSSLHVRALFKQSKISAPKLKLRKTLTCHWDDLEAKLFIITVLRTTSRGRRICFKTYWIKFEPHKPGKRSVKGLWCFICSLHAGGTQTLSAVVTTTNKWWAALSSFKWYAELTVCDA